MKLDRRVDSFGSGQAVTHERVLCRSVDGIGREFPELETHAGGSTITQPTLPCRPRPVKPDDPGILKVREANLGDQDCRFGTDSRIERLGRESRRQSSRNLSDLLSVDGDHDTIVIPAHQQVLDTGLVKCIMDGDEVGDRGVPR